MRIGMIVRGDQGGLGAMTWEVWRHILPDVTLAVDLGNRGRGPFDHTRYYNDYGEVKTYRGAVLDPATIAWLLERCDVVYTAETFYSDEFVEMARSAGVKTVLHAMPELLPPDLPVEPDAIWLPTRWRFGHVEQQHDTEIKIMPVPIDRQRLLYRQRCPEKAPSFLFVDSPAMLGRNGAPQLSEALSWVTERCHIRIRTPRPWQDTRAHVGKNVTIHFDCDDVRHYWEQYTDDVLICPRSYGGLSLTIQEAWASGMPVIGSAIDPLGAMIDYRVEADFARSRSVPMKGGNVTVTPVEPKSLAVAINEVASTPGWVTAESADHYQYLNRYWWDGDDQWWIQYRVALGQA